jgi:hypothetical protein
LTGVTGPGFTVSTVVVSVVLGAGAGAIVSVLVASVSVFFSLLQLAINNEANSIPQNKNFSAVDDGFLIIVFKI